MLNIYANLPIHNGLSDNPIRPPLSSCLAGIKNVGPSQAPISRPFLLIPEFPDRAMAKARQKSR